MLPTQRHPLDDLLGIRYEEVSAGRVLASLLLSPRIHGATGTVHGGVLAALTESAASAGGTLNTGEGEAAVCADTQIHHVRPAVSGTLHVCAVPVHRGFTQQLWSAEVFDDRNRLVSCATVQLLHVARDRAAAPAH
ncbi:PaaI family thioesterase [Streptomyces benahoarensis]|uniref:PaaI family thioesterase n=1 Tax=Streptomyces benahoarensis TaxID=2595054 RepID=A0A553Z6F7_9ACTN|nr:PaaI family thioesterase [Streptomyces benahoarensis]TSB19254.1 PaaI family thioesterase [Streptomyces benahoarensis]TSB37013.1 PaaI family thioesterase [Streptomyces benahoarensis]